MPDENEQITTETESSTVEEDEYTEDTAEHATHCLFGRKEILTAVDEITKDNLLDVLHKALGVHAFNQAQIDYLYRYMRGEQPILSRKKVVRPEICNKIVENHAAEIAEFTSGYFLGEPVTYIRRGEREEASKAVSMLNDYMFFEDKASHDKDLSTWMAICGIGYRMVLPGQGDGDSEEDSPFELDTPDPRTTFVVYHSGFGHRRMMGVRIIYREKEPNVYDRLYCGYTKTHYFEVLNGALMKWEPHILGDIPIYEYRLNMSRMGSFEPAIPLLDAINTIMSNRVDGLEQFVQSFLKFKNCDLEDKDVKKIGKLGAIFIKNAEGLDSDVTLVSQELNQEQTQTLVDYLYDQVLVICGMPSSTKGGASTSDTGQAVFLRDGWSQCEARAKDTELLFKRAEKEFLRLVLRIIRTTQDFDLSLSEVECKFTRRQHDNLQNKTQALLAMLQAGLNPEVAIATSGLFNDPMDVTEQSKEYLVKWKPIVFNPAPVKEDEEDDDTPPDNENSETDKTKPEEDEV